MSWEQVRACYSSSVFPPLLGTIFSSFWCIFLVFLSKVNNATSYVCMFFSHFLPLCYTRGSIFYILLHFDFFSWQYVLEILPSQLIEICTVCNCSISLQCMAVCHLLIPQPSVKGQSHSVLFCWYMWHHSDNLVLFVVLIWRGVYLQDTSPEADSYGKWLCSFVR